MFENLTSQQINWIDQSIAYMPNSGHFKVAEIAAKAQIADSGYEVFVSDFLTNNWLAVPHVLDIGYQSGNLILTSTGRDLRKSGSVAAYISIEKKNARKELWKSVKENVNLVFSIAAAIAGIAALVLQCQSMSQTAGGNSDSTKINADTIRKPISTGERADSTIIINKKDTLPLQDSTKVRASIDSTKKLKGRNKK